MRALTWILIAATVAGASLDINTTETLLSTGLYHEQNPVFYFLGNAGFVAFYASLTVAACLLILYLDLACQKQRCQPKLFRLGLALLSIYALFHWFLGITQLIQVINLMGGI